MKKMHKVGVDFIFVKHRIYLRLDRYNRLGIFVERLNIIRTYIILHPVDLIIDRKKKKKNN